MLGSWVALCVGGVKTERIVDCGDFGVCVLTVCVQMCISVSTRKHFLFVGNLVRKSMGRGGGFHM